MRKKALISTIMIFSVLTACKQERRTAIAYDKKAVLSGSISKITLRKSVNLWTGPSYGIYHTCLRIHLGISSIKHRPVKVKKKKKIRVVHEKNPLTDIEPSDWGGQLKFYPLILK